MSNIQAKRDDNWQPVIMGETDDANRETRPLIVDPTTERLKVESSITSGSAVEIQETAPTDSTKNNESYSITEVTVGTVTTKTIVETISGVTYTKTIATDSSDNSITISVWS